MPAAAALSNADTDEEDDAAQMLDTMRKLLAGASPEKQALFLHAAPQLSQQLNLATTLNTSMASHRSGKAEAEESVFQRLEKTRAHLEQALGEDVFFEAYQLLRTLQEGTDDDPEMETATKARIDALLAGDRQKHYQTLLHLVVSDCTHFETTRPSSADADHAAELASSLDDLDFSDEETDSAPLETVVVHEEGEAVTASQLIAKYASKTTEPPAEQGVAPPHWHSVTHARSGRGRGG